MALARATIALILAAARAFAALTLRAIMARFFRKRALRALALAP
jgi:hypothetical protein